MTPSTDVVVVNYRTPADLDKFCESLRDQQFSTLTIVNNEPNPEDVEVGEFYAKEFDGELINNEENVGYAKAVNAAASALHSEVLAIFNADVVCSRDSIRRMSEFIARRPEVGIAGPKQVNSGTRITHAGIFGPDSRPRHRGWREKDTGQYEDIRDDCFSVSGSAYFVRRKCWDQLTNYEPYQKAVWEYTGERALGAFLPSFMFWEETFCSQLARKLGWRVAYNGQVTMIHEWHQASPLGGIAEQRMPESRRMFRHVCDQLGLDHD